jgi:hypothetical protein
MLTYADAAEESAAEALSARAGKEEAGGGAEGEGDSAIFESGASRRQGKAMRGAGGVTLCKGEGESGLRAEDGRGRECAGEEQDLLGPPSSPRAAPPPPPHRACIEAEGGVGAGEGEGGGCGRRQGLAALQVAP